MPGLSARRICEAALRKIGSYTLNDAGAEANEVEEALFWLDLGVKELAGTERCFWLIPATLSMPLTASTKAYDLMAVLAADAPEDGIQFPVEATLVDGNGNRTPLERIGRREYEALTNPDSSGEPDRVFIDRLGKPTLYTYPVLGADATGYSIDLVVQTFAPAHTIKNAGEAHGLREAWERWAIFHVSADIGEGPVRRLPAGEVLGYRQQAEISRARLLAFENREHASYRPIAFRDF